MAATHAQRALTLFSKTGESSFVVLAMQGREALSEPFHYELDLLVEEANEPAFDDWLGESVQLRLDGNGGQRFFEGLCVRLERGEQVRYSDDGPRYRTFFMTVRPRFWLLTQTRRYRVFTEQSVVEILKSLLASVGPVKWDLHRDYVRRPFCAQIGESDWTFAARLMEDVGLWYFFEQTESGHQLIVTDREAGHPTVSGSVMYRRLDQSRVTRFRKWQEVGPESVTLRDVHFQLPQQPLESTTVLDGCVTVGRVTHSLRSPTAMKREVYEYPSGLASLVDVMDPSGNETPDAMKPVFASNPRRSRRRAEQYQAETLGIQGESLCLGFQPGRVFTLDGHDDADGRYLLVEVQHEVRVPPPIPGDEGRMEYRQWFRALPEGLTYRPPLRHARPRAELTTATVVGFDQSQPGEIVTDRYGRVHVRFDWDRDGRSSGWVRVAQPWAGAGHGTLFRAAQFGDEVLVGFVNGDPDRPMVLGSVVNDVNAPIEALPEQRSVSGWRTRSLGQTDCQHELRFDDRAGEETVTLHSGRDLTVEAMHDQTTTVKHDRTITVGHDEHLTVMGSLQVHCGQIEMECDATGSVTLSVGSAKIQVGPNGAIQIHGSTITIGGPDTAKLELQAAQVSVNAPSVMFQ